MTDSPDTAPKPTHAPEPRPEAGPVVVVIEDEPQIRRFLRASLTSQGFRLIEAPTRQDGLREVAMRQPDLVILDLVCGDEHRQRHLERTVHRDR